MARGLWGVVPPPLPTTPYAPYKNYIILRRDKMEDKKLPVYEVPQVVTYTDEEILEELGPAQTVYGGVTP